MPQEGAKPLGVPGRMIYTWCLALALHRSKQEVTHKYYRHTASESDEGLAFANRTLRHSAVVEGSGAVFASARMRFVPSWTCSSSARSFESLTSAERSLGRISKRAS